MQAHLKSTFISFRRKLAKYLHQKSHLCVCVCVLRVSQNAVTPPPEPSLPAAGSGPVLLLLSHRWSFHLPEQVPGATVQSFNCLQQPLSRCVQPPQPVCQDTQSPQQLWLLPRGSEPASSCRGDAAGWRHHEEGGSDPEDHPTFLCGDADHLHAALCPALLHGVSHTQGHRGQSFARVSER